MSRTIVIGIAVLLIVAAGGAAAWYFKGTQAARGFEAQCAEECRKSGRGYRLVPRDAPKTALGEQPMQCRCTN